MKTKVLALILAVMMLLTASACPAKGNDASSAPEIAGPEAVLKDFMSAMAKGDFEKAAELTTDPDELKDVMKEFEDADDDESAMMEIGMDIVKAMLGKTTLDEVKDIEIDGDKATLKATITAVDFKDIAEKVQEKYENLSEEDAQKYIDKLGGEMDMDALTELITKDVVKDMKEAISASDAETKTETIKVVFKKGEKSWLIDSDDSDDLMSAMLAGMDKLA